MTLTIQTKKILVATATLFACISICYFYVDRPVAIYFHSEETSLVAFSNMLTHLGEGVYYIVPSLILYLFFRKRDSYYAQIFLFILASVSISGIFVNILKVILGRFRPEMFFKESLYGFDWFHVTYTMVSFPSGHSATALSAWLTLALIFPKYRIALLFIGISIASTRIILTAHYCSDVIAGSTVGIVVAMIYYHRFYLKNSSFVRI